MSCDYEDRLADVPSYTKPAAARRFDPHAIARRQIPTAFRRKLLLTSIGANDERAAECSIIPALQSIRGALAAIREQGHSRRGQYFDLAYRSIAALVSSLPSRSFANAILAHAQRVRVLERLSRRVQA